MHVKSQIPSEEAIYVAVGNQIKLQRHKACVTQEFLAECIGVDQRYMSMIENGKTKTNIEICIRISKALNIPIQVLFKEFLSSENKADIDEATHYLSTLSNEKMELALSFLKALSDL